MPTQNSQGVSIREWVGMVVVALVMIGCSALGWWNLAMTEVWGFTSGGICVWLVVREHVWNWPVGLVNNVFFFFLFWQSRLYADMWLQVVYFVLGLWGWLNWIFGGERRSELKISRCSRWEWLSLAVFVPIGTVVMQKALLIANGSAPFWDALTTALSLAAQYLLCRKRLENWFFWIAADLIYVPLYLGRQLFLTAFLYAVFLIMCLIGWRHWWKSCNLTVKKNLSAAS